MEHQDPMPNVPAPRGPSPTSDAASGELAPRPSTMRCGRRAATVENRRPQAPPSRTSGCAPRAARAGRQRHPAGGAGLRVGHVAPVHLDAPARRGLADARLAVGQPRPRHLVPPAVRTSTTGTSTPRRARRRRAPAASTSAKSTTSTAAGGLDGAGRPDARSPARRSESRTLAPGATRILIWLLSVCRRLKASGVSSRPTTPVIAPA